ncbi:trypsin-like peptidase domain-containing protein [Streptomyces sp. E11-3]|uniref:VMAP-C domain-containing protein n=1 Tax=Streptomyces sp. E11-3 TaxID=3110112 RepID=UPI00397FF497
MSATVRIHRAGSGYAPDGPGDFLGSGYFVAPNWVLTCAHVVRQGEGARVKVVYETEPGRGESSVDGEVMATLPDTPRAVSPGSWPAPDLALVRLLEPADHACVYVSERPAAFYGGESVVYLGWSEVGGVLRRVNGTCAVQGTLGWADPDEQIRLGGDILPPGVSGGPVVDPVRGEVVGVLKSQLDRGLGGTSIGVEQLRALPVPDGPVGSEHDDLYQAVFHAHDRYHMDRHQHPDAAPGSWTDVQSDLGATAGRTLTPQQRTQLLGRLAELPPPTSTRGLLSLLDGLLGGQAAPRYPAPRGWRDGVGALYESRRGEGALELVLEFAMGALTAERPYATPGMDTAEERLWQWVKWTADDRSPRFRSELRHKRYTGLRPAAPDHSLGGARTAAKRECTADLAPRACVLLELEPCGWEPDRFDWRVGVVEPTGEVRPVADDSRGTSRGTALGDLPERLAPPLAEAFRQCDEPDRRAALQVALPRTLLDLDVDAWETPSGGAPLGVLRPVYVRCADLDLDLDLDMDLGPAPESGPESDQAAWDEALLESATRWRWTRVSGLRAVVVDCADGMRVPVPPERELRRLAYSTVPVLCRFDGRHRQESLAGLGRVVRGGFRVALWRRLADQQDAVCAEFHRRVTDTVVGASSAERLPDLVHELRAGLRAGRAPTYWSAGIALLYDDPRQPLPGADHILQAP